MKPEKLEELCKKLRSKISLKEKEGVTDGTWEQICDYILNYDETKLDKMEMYSHIEKCDSCNL